MENSSLDNTTSPLADPNENQGGDPIASAGETLPMRMNQPPESEPAQAGSPVESNPPSTALQVDDPLAAGETIPAYVNPSSAASPVVEVSPNPKPAAPSDQPPKKPISWPRVTILGILALVLIAALSGFGGYRSGINLRTSAESTQVVGQLDEQFAQAKQDMADKQYDRARQRFEYIIQHNPNYPGAAEMLSNVLVNMSTTATPTLAATPTVTPTPDTRAVDTLFTQAQQDMQQGNWSAAIDTLLALRKADPTNHPVDVDGMLYLAFRNLGKDRIIKTDLEGGLYDLSLAQRFGPLDSEALGLQNWVRLYITGASFWEIDWKQAIFYFSQVGPAMPSLMDASGMTASERYRIALIGYGDDLAKDHQWCDAQKQYELSLSIGPDPKGHAGPALQEATNNCSGNSNQPPPAGGNPSEVPPTPPSSGGPTATLAPPPPAATATEAPPPTSPPAATPTEKAPPPTAIPTQ